MLSKIHVCKSQISTILTTKKTIIKMENFHWFLYSILGIFKKENELISFFELHSWRSIHVWFNWLFGDLKQVIGNGRELDIVLTHDSSHDGITVYHNLFSKFYYGKICKIS